MLTKKARKREQSNAREQQKQRRNEVPNKRVHDGEDDDTGGLFDLMLESSC